MLCFYIWSLMCFSSTSPETTAFLPNNVTNYTKLTKNHSVALQKWIPFIPRESRFIFLFFLMKKLPVVSRLCLQCRYTLQYTYPYAYYMESGPRKKLVRVVLLMKFWPVVSCRLWRVSDVLDVSLQFEYQQAQLEAEIENLSWKVERADSYERGVVGGEGELSASDRGVRESDAWWVERKITCDKLTDSLVMILVFSFYLENKPWNVSVWRMIYFDHLNSLLCNSVELLQQRNTGLVFAWGHCVSRGVCLSQNKLVWIFRK